MGGRNKLSWRILHNKRPAVVSERLGDTPKAKKRVVPNRLNYMPEIKQPIVLLHRLEEMPEAKKYLEAIEARNREAREAKKRVVPNRPNYMPEIKQPIVLLHRLEEMPEAKKYLEAIEARNREAREAKKRVVPNRPNYMPEIKQPIVLLHRLEEMPEAKKYLEAIEARNAEQQRKMAEKKKERKSKSVDRASRKRKSGNDEKPAVRTEETTLEIDSQLNPTPLSHISLRSPIDIEMELVYTDDEDIPFEFPALMVSSSTESPGCDSGKAAGPSTSCGSSWTRISEWLQCVLQEASTCYQQNNYAGALEKFSTALELCSNGLSTADFCSEDASSIASFVEAKLVICCLKLGKPDDALNHAHRSIIMNPSYFRNHLRQAAVFRCLNRYSEAARSAMIADYMYWLTGGTEENTRELLKEYWQAMIEEATTQVVSFSVLYTPFPREAKADERNMLRDAFVKKNPNYSEHIYTDPRGFHFLPHSAEWQSRPPTKHVLTLGFRNKHIGKILERWSNKQVPIFPDRNLPFCPPTKEEAKRFWDNTGKKIMPVIDFIRSSKLIDNTCPCACGIEKLHYASLLGNLERDEEKSQVINQAMAELATLPYLQAMSEHDARLMLSLMSDAMDILQGRNDEGRVWNKIQKIGLIEDYLYQVEDNYLKNKRHRMSRTERMKRTQGTQQNNRPGDTNLPSTSRGDRATQQKRFMP